MLNKYYGLYQVITSLLDYSSGSSKEYEPGNAEFDSPDTETDNVNDSLSNSRPNVNNISIVESTRTDTITLLEAIQRKEEEDI